MNKIFTLLLTSLFIAPLFSQSEVVVSDYYEVTSDLVTQVERAITSDNISIFKDSSIHPYITEKSFTGFMTISEMVAAMDKVNIFNYLFKNNLIDINSSKLKEILIQNGSIKILEKFYSKIDGVVIDSSEIFSVDKSYTIKRYMGDDKALLTKDNREYYTEAGFIYGPFDQFFSAERTSNNLYISCLIDDKQYYLTKDKSYGPYIKTPLSRTYTMDNSPNLYFSYKDTNKKYTIRSLDEVFIDNADDISFSNRWTSLKFNYKRDGKEYILIPGVLNKLKNEVYGLTHNNTGYSYYSLSRFNTEGWTKAKSLTGKSVEFNGERSTMFESIETVEKMDHLFIGHRYGLSYLVGDSGGIDRPFKSIIQRGRFLELFDDSGRFILTTDLNLIGPIPSETKVISTNSSVILTKKDDKYSILYSPVKMDEIQNVDDRYNIVYNSNGRTHILLEDRFIDTGHSGKFLSLRNFPSEYLITFDNNYSLLVKKDSLRSKDSYSLSLPTKHLLVGDSRGNKCQMILNSQTEHPRDGYVAGLGDNYYVTDSSTKVLMGPYNEVLSTIEHMGELYVLGIRGGKSYLENSSGSVKKHVKRVKSKHKASIYSVNSRDPEGVAIRFLDKRYINESGYTIRGATYEHYILKENKYLKKVHNYAYAKDNYIYSYTEKNQEERSSIITNFGEFYLSGPIRSIDISRDGSFAIIYVTDWYYEDDFIYRLDLNKELNLKKIYSGHRVDGVQFLSQSDSFVYINEWTLLNTLTGDEHTGEGLDKGYYGKGKLGLFNDDTMKYIDEYGNSYDLNEYDIDYDLSRKAVFNNNDYDRYIVTNGRVNGPYKSIDSDNSNPVDGYYVYNRDSYTKYYINYRGVEYQIISTRNDGFFKTTEGEIVLPVVIDGKKYLVLNGVKKSIETLISPNSSFHINNGNFYWYQIIEDRVVKHSISSLSN